MTGTAKLLIAAGLLLITVGMIIAVAQRFGLGRLPGDILLRRDNFTFSFPIVTCLLVSALLTLIFWLVSRFGGRS